MLDQDAYNLPMIQQGTMPVEMVQEILLFTVSSHKHGKQLEDVITGLGEQMGNLQNLQQVQQQLEQTQQQLQQVTQQGQQQVQQVGAGGRQQIAKQYRLEIDCGPGQQADQNNAAGEPGVRNDRQRGFR